MPRTVVVPRPEIFNPIPLYPGRDNLEGMIYASFLGLLLAHGVRKLVPGAWSGTLHGVNLLAGLGMMIYILGCSMVESGRHDNILTPLVTLFLGVIVCWLPMVVMLASPGRNIFLGWLYALLAMEIIRIPFRWLWRFWLLIHPELIEAEPENGPRFQWVNDGF